MSDPRHASPAPAGKSTARRSTEDASPGPFAALAPAHAAADPFPALALARLRVLAGGLGPLDGDRLLERIAGLDEYEPLRAVLLVLGAGALLRGPR